MKRKKSKPSIESKRRAERASPPRRKSSVSPAKPRGVANGAERLQKVLAAAGVASRRECEALITEGRVEIDGEIVTELGTKVDPAAHDVRVDGEPIRKPKRVCYAIHKPPGVLSTTNDPAGRMRVIDLAPESSERVYNIGRLDAASEGLILVTNDGELANLLTHPRHGVEKTYHVTVAGAVKADALARIRRGEYLAEGFARVARASVRKRHAKSTVLEIVLDEGRNREIRRLLARVGHKVQRLVRVAIGPLRLGTLPIGEARKLTRTEVSELRKSVGHKPTKKPRGRKKPSSANSSLDAPAKRPGDNGQRGRSVKTNKRKGAVRLGRRKR